MGLVRTKQSSSRVHRAGTSLEPQLKHIRSTALQEETPGGRERGGERWVLSSTQFWKTSCWQKCWGSKSSLLAGRTASPLLNIHLFHMLPDSPSPVQLLSVLGREDQVLGFSGSPPREGALLQNPHPNSSSKCPDMPGPITHQKPSFKVPSTQISSKH